MISILTPTLNQGATIEETIVSVASLGYPSFDIVVDCGSTDPRYLDWYSHVRWISERDCGQGDAINKGIGMSSGAVVSYLNSDDVYRPGAFEAVGEAFAECPGAPVDARRRRSERPYLRPAGGPRSSPRDRTVAAAL